VAQLFSLGIIAHMSTSQSKCEFCGAPAGVGWGSAIYNLADGTKKEEEHFWCDKCREDLDEFESNPQNRMPRFPDDFDFSDPKAMEPVERLMQEIKERKIPFMRERVAKRKGPDA
jgi:hypothetical protein